MEYEKRLRKDIQIINNKSSKKDTPFEIIHQDTLEIIKILQKEKSKKPFVVLLSKEGKSRTTEQWSFMIESKKNEGQEIRFLIGWPYGFEEDGLKWYVDLELSFGEATMPHGLVKLVVLEQIYRCFQIISGKQYHY
jgi:23S rRNA (pseudouridine1915-N3)-methyltransferase